MKKQLDYNRYQRQMALPEIGISGQKKLLNAKVLVVGAGGLGCPVLQYLTAGGVGTIGIVDGDIVDESNLHRQILFDSHDKGCYKSQVAQLKLNQLNEDCKVICYKEMLNVSNALSIISEFDLVIDGSDNYPTRYLVNDACFILNKPLVYGAVLQYEGQVGVFNLQDKQTGIITNYRDLFPKPPHPSEVHSCAEAGVIGVLPGIIGTLQAAEAIKIITEVGKPLCNKVLIYNMKNASFYDFEIRPNPQKGTFPHTVRQFFEFDYDWFCVGEISDFEINTEAFDQWLFQENILVIDVREKYELPVLEGVQYLSIPASEWETRKTEFISDKTVVVVCQSGVRSLKIVNQIKKIHTNRAIYSLHGGVNHWVKNKAI